MLSGCTSMLSTSEKLALSSLYGITENYYEDIKGNYTVFRLLLYKDFSLTTSETITLDKIVTSTSISYTITVEYLGQDWLFLESIEIKIDNITIQI